MKEENKTQETVSENLESQTEEKKEEAPENLNF